MDRCVELVTCIRRNIDECYDQEAWASAPEGAASSSQDEELSGAAAQISSAEAEGRMGQESPWRAFIGTASLIFVAEWGDRSMLATIALGAAQSPYGRHTTVHTPLRHTRTHARRQARSLHLASMNIRFRQNGVNMPTDIYFGSMCRCCNRCYSWPYHCHCNSSNWRCHCWQICVREDCQLHQWKSISHICYCNTGWRVLMLIS